MAIDINTKRRGRGRPGRGFPEEPLSQNLPVERGQNLIRSPLFKRRPLFGGQPEPENEPEPEPVFTNSIQIYGWRIGDYHQAPQTVNGVVLSNGTGFGFARLLATITDEAEVDLLLTKPEDDETILVLAEIDLVNSTVTGATLTPTPAFDWSGEGTLTLGLPEQVGDLVLKFTTQDDS